MRKLLLVVVIALHSTFIFTNNSCTMVHQSKPDPYSLTKDEKVKIVLALGGCVFFTIGALTTPIFDNSTYRDFKLTPENFAASLCLLPMFLIQRNRAYLKIRLLKNHVHYLRNIGTAYSAIIAYILGKYAYQKIHSQLIHTSNKKEGKSPLINDIN